MTFLIKKHIFFSINANKYIVNFPTFLSFQCAINFSQNIEVRFQLAGLDLSS